MTEGMRGWKEHAYVEKNESGNRVLDFAMPFDLILVTCFTNKDEDLITF